MKTIVFFNNKGGVGKTSLVYHLSWMYADLGLRVVAVDLDPQANLTSMFLDVNRLEELWPDGDHSTTVFGAVEPIVRGIGDITPPEIEKIAEGLGLITGDLALSRFEAKLSAAWPSCLDQDEAAFRIVSSFYRIVVKAADTYRADLALIDVGPNLGAINRSALISAEHVVVPLAADLFSLQGLRNLGPQLREWRSEWIDRLDRKPPDLKLVLPSADMDPVGYIVLQHATRMDRPVKAYEKWTSRIPGIYRHAVLNEDSTNAPDVADDPNCLAMLKNYRSLMPLSQDSHKPMFFLKPADGALGGHVHAVQNCYDDFKRLASNIAQRCGVDL